MWKLTIEDDEGKQTTLPLAHDEYALGRDEANSIRLTDRNISRKHAVLSKNGQGWTVRDLDSYNGTFVNGVRVAGDQHLRHADLVQLGDYRLEVIDESLLAVPTPAPEGRGTTLSPLHTRPDRLVMIVGPTPGAEFALDGERLNIGRSEECSVSINHSSVSRLHAELLKIDKGRYEVIDQGSANGIRINGVELKRGLLEAGDALELGDVRLRFVGAGKIFRPVETSLLNPVVTPAGAHGAQSGLRGGGGTWKIAVALVLLVALGGAAIFAITHTPTDDGKQVEGAAATRPEDQERGLLQRAKEALDRGEYDKAHDLAQQIPEASVVRQDPLFREVENRWAQRNIERGQDGSLSTAQRYELLASVAGTPTVDANLRDRAIELMAVVVEQDPTLPPPPERMRPNQKRPPGGTATTTPTSKTAPNQSPTTTSKTQETAAAQVPELSGYAAQRRQLEPKVWGGRATIEEIKLLRAYCSHMEDKACRDRATAMLKQREAAGQ
ncbi:FHA domain-containing protein [Chondromyces crocatus]|uniref:FHA domain-containing protein n=1 Tax=Chondromyces crocatus TaxID=52 RepID=A0A0K1EBM2_CHOCO|nr:FHA domain-containing protein [Chondromyces crocatus]AKT38286.1 uncharacterized protein CMC5_024310 [Chondromyces crocatus]